MNEKNENDPLFLVVEQGAGKYKNDVNIVINPKTKMLSKKWLREEYPLLTMRDMKEMKTSVIEEEINCDDKYSNNLKEFLRPTFENVSNNKQKKMGK